MNNSSTLLVDEHTLLKDALVLMDRAGEGFLVVQNKAGNVVGVIADGDVRRALIANLSLESPVCEMMNRAFKFGKNTETREASFRYLKTLKCRQLPILDEEKNLIDILFVDHVTPSHRDNPVVIMAGGLGTRLRPFTETVPKPMLRVGNKPFLQGIIENLIAQGFHRFYFCVNYLAEQIVEYFKDGSQWGVDIQYVHENKRLGTAGALGLIQDPGTQPLLVMNGDLVTKVDFGALLDHHLQQDKIATMAVRHMDFQIPFGVVEVSEFDVLGIEEKPIKKFLVNAGIYVIDPVCLKNIPRDEMFDMPTLLGTLVEENSSVGYFPLYESWLDVGRVEDYQFALKSHGQQDETS